MKFNRELGFTLLEMLIVLLVIAVLIILIIPNLVGKTSDIQSQGCDALVSVVETQMNAYQLDKGKLPANISTLVSNNYLDKDQTRCPNNKRLEIVNGKVTISSDRN